MADVSVTFLGSGDAFGSGGRFQTCVLVTSSTTRFLLDCGASSLIALKKQGVSPGICEAYCFDKAMRFHLDYQSLLAHESKLSCKRLVLTHMSEDMLKRRFEMKAEWAEDGMTIPL